ncbi:MAG TPA: enoyl-CoA hydratase/isomerase family protein, partial [Microthrixaceae bacterium]|nr:enoyl-CoA hydratase/isomerase family protein [Microthrixaceae bacterium]
MSIVSYSRDGAVARLTISRPERRNALNHTALDELHDGVRRAAADQVRVLVLTGDADQFCAGADLKELEDLAFTRALRAALDDLAALPFPTVAAISGACMGLGMQLALSCDLRLATPDARFAVPVAKLGLMVDHWTIQRLALLAGPSTARWMVLTAR